MDAVWNCTLKWSVSTCPVWIGDTLVVARSGGTDLAVPSYMDVTTASPKGHGNRSAQSFQCQSIRPDARPALLAWLNRGLRKNRKRRLEAEFPSALFSRDPASDLQKHVVVRCGGRLASHVLVHTIPVEALGLQIELGMIGMVYTDPDFRGRGAASLALDQALAQLKERGIPLAILWSDLDAFYNRLGFDRAGVENFYLLSSAQCQLASRSDCDRVTVRPVAETDWQDLEHLYAGKPSRHLRPAGELARLAAAPDCETLVAIQGGVLTAYASMGRGDDLTGVVHEWAGDGDGLVACLLRFTQTRDEVTLLEGPVHEAATRPLRITGTRPHPGTLGLMQILDVEKLWSALSIGCESLSEIRLTADSGFYVFETPGRSFKLSHSDALSLLVGPSVPRALQLGLEPELRDALGTRFPWPLFLWGFDSI